MEREIEEKYIHKRPFAIIAMILIIISFIVLFANSANWYWYIISFITISELTRFLVKKFIKKLGENVKIKS